MHDFQRIAPVLANLDPDPAAHIYYDVFADALVWSDEMPRSGTYFGEQPMSWSLRGVWHYRTLIILGEPAEKFRAAWEEAHRYFPTWPGFLPSRRDPALAATANELRTAGMKRWIEQEDKYNDQIAAQAASSPLDPAIAS